MWVLVGNGLIYLGGNVIGGRLRHKFFPWSPRAFLADVLAALKGKLEHADLSHYNMVQRAAYLFVMLDSILLVLSGLVLWKSVQFPILRELLGGYEAARREHFSGHGGAGWLRRYPFGHGGAGSPHAARHDPRPLGSKRHDQENYPSARIRSRPRSCRCAQGNRAPPRTTGPPQLSPAQSDLGGLSLLSGCAITDENSVETALMGIALQRQGAGLAVRFHSSGADLSRFDDHPSVPFNAYYGEDEIREIEEEGYRLEVTGLVADKRLDAGRAARHAANRSGHPAHLRRRLERHR
jgi:hypothetical protein